MTTEDLKRLRSSILSDATTLGFDYVLHNCTPFGDTIHGHRDALKTAPDWLQYAVWHIEQAVGQLNIGILGQEQEEASDDH